MMNAMEMTETLTYDAEPTRVFEMLCDKSWREDVCKAVRAIDYAVSIEENGDELVVTTRRVLPARVPDAVRRLTGDTLTITQVERWGAASADGSRTADLDVRVSGQPAGMTGDMHLSPVPGGTTHLVRGDVRVTVPFLGKKVEPQMARAFRAAVRTEGEVGRAYLAS